MSRAGLQVPRTTVTMGRPGPGRASSSPATPAAALSQRRGGAQAAEAEAAAAD